MLFWREGRVWLQLLLFVFVLDFMPALLSVFARFSYGDFDALFCECLAQRRAFMNTGELLSGVDLETATKTRRQGRDLAASYLRTILLEGRICLCDVDERESETGTELSACHCLDISK